jgi:RecA/RadA recombinase
MIEFELTYKQLYDLYGGGEHEIPYNVDDEIFVRTPTGFTKINQVVTKHNNEVIRVDFDDGDKFECSVNHLFCDYHTGVEVSSVDAKEVTSTYGKKTVVEKTPIGFENVYDISINSPHWYIANQKSGIYHHNTFFSLSVVKNFLDLNPDGYCLYFDTEAAVTKKMLTEKGIDLSRVVVLNVVTIEEFRTKALKAVDLYMKADKKNRKPCMFVLDSLGMLSTNKEIDDTLQEKNVKDMTKASLIKAAFRMLTLKLGQADIPMIVTNHIYANVGGYGPTHVQSGGSGLLYSASTIIELSKSKEKEGSEVVGNIIKAKTFKSRLSKENQEVSVRLYYDDRGLDKYYGLVEIGEEAGIIPRVGNRYEINGKKIGRNVIYANPEEYFTPELLEKLDEYAQKKFKYGSSLAEEPVVTEEDD